MGTLVNGGMMPINKGHVSFLGAGPGHPDLLTLRAVKVLKQADVILYDQLSHPNCLSYTKVGAECISVGKQKGHHSKQQKEINEIKNKLKSS